ncbi:MAG TPA: YciI family protein [Streptosporangiaceae bacterium]|nr:YciI family protein [Streptosporangiaceae bacterium]
MQQYLLSVYQPDQGTPEPAVLDKIMRDVGAWEAGLKDAGAWVFTAGLFGVESATVVRAGESGMLATDGPYAEGKEHIGGFTIVQVADLDAALHSAHRLSEITGLPIEVRPVRSGDGR